jgi:hypothetical protein
VPDSGAMISSMFEWSLAAHWDGLTTYEFLGLEVEQQCHIIAAFRIDRMLEAVKAKEQSDEMEARSRRK